MTRHQQRLNARYEKNPTIENRDAIIGDAIYRRNQSRINPIDRMIRQQGLTATAKYARSLGVDFVDFYVSVFRVMPRGM